MRFNNEFTLIHRLGERRIVRKFLLIPRTFGRTRIRWLEFADILEQVKYKWDSNGCRWVEIDFYDDDDK